MYNFSFDGRAVCSDGLTRLRHAVASLHNQLIRIDMVESTSEHGDVPVP